MKKFEVLFTISLFITLFVSCKKADHWLDEKIRLNDVRPQTIEDFQAILNSDNVLNSNFSGLSQQASDNYYLSDENYSANNQFDRDVYTWKRDLAGDALTYDWGNYYQIIEQANIVLDGLKEITVTGNNRAEYDKTKGWALFFRSYAYYWLSQLYCPPYDKVSSATDLGLVIRSSSDVNEKSVRSSVSTTYEYMIADLEEAVAMLQDKAPYQTQPTRPAALALLSKIYLNMAQYEQAYEYSNAALQIANTLMDFNNTQQVIIANSIPFPNFQKNTEIVFWASATANLPVVPGYGLGYVNSNLYNSYAENDLRKQAFYFEVAPDVYGFRGTYYGTLDASVSYSLLFAGIACNELYLIRAESAARTNKVAEAIADLNALMVKRYRTGSFIPFTTSDAEEALKLVINERRKELPFSSQTTWEDLRRLNKDPRFARTLSRMVNGTTYTLAPNDLRYTFPIPQTEIQLSGIEQNHR